MDGQATANTIDIHRIVQMIPHRYPFLLVDRLLDCHPRRECDGPQERHDQ